MKTSSVFDKNISAFNEGYRVVVNKGSTRSSKTWSILQLLYTIASLSSNPLLISIVSESVPHLKKGCIRDFQSMLMNEGKWFESNWNVTDKIYKVGKSKIEFFSSDTPSKVHGPSRDILYVNECNNIFYETYRQMAIRTRMMIFLDYNPLSEFWVDEKVLTRDNAKLIHSTYKDNDFLTAAQIEEIESNKEDKEWWKVYGLGITGSKEGLIFQNYAIIESMPDLYKSQWLGMDFGFSNDPSTIIDVRLSGGELWLDELMYQRGVDNIRIAKFLKEQGFTKQTSIVADSAEPKSISEINSFGFSIESAVKGADSILNGIQILQRYKLNITKRSVDTIKEVRNYKWKTDINGKPLNIPIDLWNHSLDAIRYVAINKLLMKKKTGAATYGW